MCASSQTQRTELFLDLQRFLNTRQSPETCRFYKAKLTPFLTWLQGQGVTELEGTTPQLVRVSIAARCIPPMIALVYTTDTSWTGLQKRV